MEALSSTRGDRSQEWGAGGSEPGEPARPSTPGASIRLSAEPSTYTREGYLIAHKNDLLGVSFFNKLRGEGGRRGDGQSPALYLSDQ